MNNEPVILDERLAMHLMMLDVYFKGAVLLALQDLDFKSAKKSSWETYLTNDDPYKSSGWIWIKDMRATFIAPLSEVLENFFDNLAAEKNETPEGNKAWEQHQIWLRLYSGLNSIRVKQTSKT